MRDSWLLRVGRAIICRGQRQLVDRRERRDLSLARIGRDTIEKWLALGGPLRIAPDFVVSGG